LIERIVAQSERRVLHGEPSPAAAKLVSLVEPHADIIRKGREVAYGHKLNLTTGRSGLILDLVIEAGNPADSERLLPMLEATARSMVSRRVRPPPMAATPGDKSAQAKARGVRDMAFPKGKSQQTWSGAAGPIASSGTSAPASRPTSRASSGPMVWRVRLTGLGRFRAYVWAPVVA
jgi:IS5 family transposase